MAKKKYEVLHAIRPERRTRIRPGSVVELDADEAYRLRHAVRLLPEDVQDQPEQAPQTRAREHEQEEPQREVQKDTAPPDEDTRERPDVLATEEASAAGKPRITEAARKEAEKQGISLEHVEARGRGNTLTKADVQREAARLRRLRAEKE